ncbi:MAG: TRAP transporter small permease subunit [Candidatus Rokubacteria bacterium]|nr:TRAP transporter small permease subunit [Candidatus Rokubacteria bacterium]
MRTTIKILDAVSLWAGRLFGWLVIPLIGVLVYEVVMRKFFIRPTAWASDISYMLYGSLFMMGAPYTLLRKGHIRTDFLYRLWSPRVQGSVDALLYFFFFFPGMGLFLWASWDFAYIAWIRDERAITSAWLPPIYPFKFVMPVATALLLIQGVSEFLKSLHAVLRGTWS